MDNGWFSGGNSKRTWFQGGGISEGYADTFRKKLADQATIMAQAGDEKRRKELAKKQPENVNNIKKTAGDIGNAVVGFGKGIVDNAVQGVKTTTEFLDELGGKSNMQVKLLDDQRKYLDDQFKQGKISKDRYQAGLQKVSDLQAKVSKNIKASDLQIRDRTQIAGDVAGTFLDVATAGFGSEVATQTAKQVASQTGKSLVKSVGRNVLEGTPLGTAYGANQVARDKGDNATAQDYTGGAVTGGLVGGAAGAFTPVLGATVKKVGEIKLPTITETKFGQDVAQSKLGQKITNIKDTFVAKIVDDTNLIKKQFKGLTDESSGRKVSDEIEDRVTNVRQFAALSQDRLQNNQAFQELIPLIGGDKKKYKELGDFISQKQQAINEAKVGRGGVAIKGTPEQEQAYSLLNQATKDDIQYLFDNGKITKDKYDQWINDPNYTRVQKEVLDEQAKQYGKSGLVSASSVTQQKLKGSTKKSIDPFASYEDWSRQVTLEVEKNNLAKYMRDQLVKNGRSNQIQTTGAAIDRIRQLYGEEGVKQRTLPVFENGVKELYTIDPGAARQLSGMADLELKAISDFALAPSRLLRAGATAFNPAFAVPNFIKDQISSSVLSKNALSTHNPLVFFQGLKEAILKPTINATVGRLPGLAQKGTKLWEPSDLYKEWLSRNANITRADLSRNLKKATRQSLEDLGVKREGFLRKYENVISASEKATRYQNFLGTYKKALKQKKTPEQAISLANRAARDNSVNFSNRGEIASFMKIFNPYFNASIQGSRTLARAFKNRPVATSLKVGTTLLMPVAASTYYNLSDPDRAAVYANIPDYERNSNLIMVLGGNRGYIKIPLPPGMKEFANPVRNLVESEYLGDRQSLMQSAKNIFVDAFNPLGTTPNEMVSNAIPQVAKPIVEAGMNKNLFTGREIVPQDLQGLPSNQQAYDSTPQIYKDIGGLLNVSPLQVQNTVKGYTAGAGEGALTTADLARGAETGGRSTPEQLLGRFYSPDVKGSGRVSSKFYEAYTPLKAQKENVSQKITNAVKSGDIDKASELARNINTKIDKEKDRLSTTYGRYEVDLSGLFDQLDSLKIPMDGDYLSSRSIKSRQKQKN